MPDREGEVLAAASSSLAAAIHALHFAQDRPYMSILSSPTMTIGSCGRTLEAGKTPQARSNE